MSEIRIPTANGYIALPPAEGAILRPLKNGDTEITIVDGRKRKKFIAETTIVAVQTAINLAAELQSVEAKRSITN